MSLIQTFFPTCAYIENRILSDGQRINLYEKTLKYSEDIRPGGKQWKANVKNNHGYSDLNADDDFKKLEGIVTEHVNYFATSLMSDFKYTCNSSWYNIYDENSYQEYHIHTVYSRWRHTKTDEVLHTGQIDFCHILRLDDPLGC
jgi:hypothetical protein